MGSAHRNTRTCRLSASPYWLYKGVNFVCVLEEQLSTWRQERRTALLCHIHCIRPRNTPLVYIRGSQTFFKSNFSVSPIDFLYTDKTPEIGKTDWERTWVLYCIVLYWFDLNCIVFYFIVLYWFELYCIALYWFELYCIVLIWIVLYYIVLYFYFGSIKSSTCQ